MTCRKLSFISRIEFIRFKLSIFFGHVTSNRLRYCVVSACMLWFVVILWRFCGDFVAMPCWWLWWRGLRTAVGCPYSLCCCRPTEPGRGVHLMHCQRSDFWNMSSTYIHSYIRYVVHTAIFLMRRVVLHSLNDCMSRVARQLQNAFCYQLFFHALRPLLSPHVSGLPVISVIDDQTELSCAAVERIISWTFQLHPFRHFGVYFERTFQHLLSITLPELVHFSNHRAALIALVKSLDVANLEHPAAFDRRDRRFPFDHFSNIILIFWVLEQGAYLKLIFSFFYWPLIEVFYWPLIEV